MTRTRPSDDRGRIEVRGNSLRVFVYAGLDPVTGKRTYLLELIKGTDKAAEKRAQKALHKILAQVDAQRAPTSSVSFSHAVDEWMRTSELQDSTRRTYEGYIARTIGPVLGELPVRKIDARILEAFYAELRRCRTRCNGTPFIEHKTDAEHDWRGHALARCGDPAAVQVLS